MTETNTLLRPAWQVSTDDAPPDDRFGALNDLVAEAYLCRITPYGSSGCGAYIHAGSMALGDVILAKTCHSGVVYTRSGSHARERDEVSFNISLSGRAGVQQDGSEYRLSAGTGFLSLFDNPEHVHLVPAEEDYESLTLVLPRGILATAGVDTDRVLQRPQLCGSPAMRLLAAYVQNILRDPEPVAPEMTATLSSHICDLAVLAMGAAGDDAAEAAQGGLRAARLDAIKKDIIGRIGRRGISLEEIAICHGISPVYVQKLFEMEGTNFSAFVMAQKLDKARRMLCSHRYTALNISAIAYESGFNDLSHFSRSFRKRYGLSPSDLRYNARRSAVAGHRRSDA